MKSQVLSSLVAVVACAFPALAQEEFSVDWHTVDCGGGSSNGEEFLVLATIAQPDAGYMSGGESAETFEITGGFWIEGLPPGACYPNCDNSSGSPLLTPNDFLCFLNSYAEGRSYANCDGSIGTPALTPNDFLCFVNQYASGCP